MSTAIRGAGGLALAGGTLVVAALLLRGPLEASMALHMVVQLPMIAVGGALAGRALTGKSARVAGAVARWDAHGLAGLVWLLLASAYWMVPRALEQPLTMPLAEAGKFASLFMLGFLLPGALARAAAVIQLFFLGNFCAMMAIAGLLYQDMAQRLCNAYSLNDQVVTGVGLVVASIGIAAAWCVWQLPALANQADHA
ncbi:hypothetical protein SAMN05518865_112150 [Duganella sp. CF458]|uniref:hypothetical protein n=1 Tax=Duganella sp. CF458 TaxID=1884368 RepID=UPI0008EF5F71|nr:hypothetical protein [Duganella sp. CF458]SFG45978.1 hypothetical protein SAMN05518865_112150 [Duganella sp. CF458]